MAALQKTIAENRGLDLGQTEIQSKIERGKRFMPAAPKGDKKKGPVNTLGEENRKGGRGGRGGNRGGGGGGRGGPRGGSGGGPGGGQGAPQGGPQGGGDAAPAGDSAKN